MVESRLLDVYEVAYLAGGLDRVVDTALVALVETGRVRVQRSGTLCVVENRPSHDVEAAVLDAIGSGSRHQLSIVRYWVRRDERLTRVVERLRHHGLLAEKGLARMLGRMNRSLLLTATGRQLLSTLRADPPVRGVAAGTSAAQVALGGSRYMSDPVLRTVLFEPPPPPRPRSYASHGAPRARRKRHSVFSWAADGGSSWGGDGGGWGGGDGGGGWGGGGWGGGDGGGGWGGGDGGGGGGGGCGGGGG